MGQTGQTPSFGARLKRAREARGITVLALAGLTEIQPRTIERWELGLHDPKVEDAAKVALALDVSLDELAGLLNDGAAA
jgi:transcriptional regulator with XRE-family HTH domain